VVAAEKGIFRSISSKNFKKIILPKLDRIFKINFPTTCRELKNNLQPSWSEDQNPTSAQLGQKLKNHFAASCIEVENVTSTQVV